MSQDNELICGYKDFLAKGKTERECVAFLVKEAEKNDVQGTYLIDISSKEVIKRKVDEVRGCRCCGRKD